MAVAATAAGILVGSALFAMHRGPDPGERPVAGDRENRQPGPHRRLVTPGPSPLDERATTDEIRAFIRSCLADPEPATRKAACDAVADTRDVDVDVIDPLIALVERDPDLTVRTRSAWALSLLGARQAIPTLRALHEDAEPAVAVWYAEALYWLGDTRRARRWLVRYARHRDLDVSFKATLALAQVSEPGNREALGALARVLEHKGEFEDPYLEAPILAHLARLGQARARDALIGLLTDNDEGMRVHAATALARIGDDSGQDALTLVLHDEQSTNRAVAAAGLVLLGDYSGYEILVATLDHREAPIRAECASALQVIAHRSSLRPLLDLYRKDPDKAVRLRAAVAVLFVLGLDPRQLTEASVRWTEEALQSQDGAIRAAAARVVGDLPTERAEQLLAAVIADPDVRVREAVTRSAARIKTPAAARAVATAMARESDPAVREMQIKVVAEIAQRDPEAEAVLAGVVEQGGRPGALALGALVALGELDRAGDLTTMYSSGGLGVREAAVDAALLARNPVVVPTLELGLDDAIFAIRFKAAEGMARFLAGRDRSIAVLEEGLGKSPEIAARAYAALRAFGVAAVGGKSNEEWAEASAGLLASSDPAQRRAVWPTVATLSWRQATPLIQTGLKDPDPEVQRAAVDAIAAVADDNREAARRLYKSVLNDNPDPALQSSARVRLARLIETRPDGEPEAVESVEPGPLEDLGLRAAADGQREAAVAAATRALGESSAGFDAAAARVTGMLGDLADRTGKEAPDERAIDEVQELVRTLGEARAQLFPARDQMSARVAEVVRLGAPLAANRPGVAGDVAGAQARLREVGAALARLDRETGDALDRAGTWLEKQIASCDLYLASVEGAVAAGDLRAARRDLARARATCRDGGATQLRYHEAAGQYHDRRASEARSDRQRRRELEKARDSYRRFAQSGTGYRAERARERLAEIERELANLEGRP